MEDNYFFNFWEDIINKNKILIKMIKSTKQVISLNSLN